jgi:hypothetical protein
MLDIEVTPWKWQKDLIQVRSQLYHQVKSQPDERNEGVDTVRISPEKSGEESLC